MTYKLRNLAKACEAAFARDPSLWVDEGVGVFNFPEYGGLPARYHLTPDAVDVIQMYIEENLIEGIGGRTVQLDAESLFHFMLSYRKLGYDI